MTQSQEQNTASFDPMLDVFLKLYELNENYHYQKEKRAWIAAAGYIGFSLIAIKWLAGQNIPSFCTAQSRWLTIFIIVVYACAMSFIFLQFLGRWQSVAKTHAYNRILYGIQAGEPVPPLEALYEDDIEYRIAGERKLSQILILTVFCPLFFLIWIIYTSCLTKKKRKKTSCQWRWVRCIKRWRWCCSIVRYLKGLMDSRYMTEIPTYTIATWSLFIQISMIWEWGLFPLGNTP